ncbi:hypothetical protein ANN_20927 [Periplaneta americana]|uniref:Reverse transcriptase domain-containing protein n=1 Tax=Periplaneta americana TaxID=6978 RepID=A0ABQ8SEE4_PERAM|nr:hypothetical protein ANN_20927 [Periplaneta americana]
MWIWRRMERVKWTDRIRNEAVLGRVGEERRMLKLIRKRKRNWLAHWLRRNCLSKDALEGMVNERRVRGKRRCQMIDSIKIYGSYDETKRRLRMFVTRAKLDGVVSPGTLMTSVSKAQADYKTSMSSDLCYVEAHAIRPENEKNSEAFPIHCGLKQGDALSPLLFNFVLECAIRKFQDNRQGLELNGIHQLLVHADDVNMLENSQTIRESTDFT